jgi:hypothetical protein
MVACGVRALAYSTGRPRERIKGEGRGGDRVREQAVRNEK